MMVCDVAGALDATTGTDEPGLLRAFLGCVRAWQEFMRKGAEALSPGAEIGLVGELVLLSAVIEAGVSAGPAIESWVGPHSGAQDFELGTGAVEVKATLSPVGFPARIGSLEQLDDSVRQPLFVAGVRLRQAPFGKSLPEFVEGLRAMLQGDPEAERLFAERLLAAGYIAAHVARYSRQFELATMRLIRVSDGFPRLTIGRVPVGVTDVMYGIDLDQAPGEFEVLESALKKLGVL